MTVRKIIDTKILISNLLLENDIATYSEISDLRDNIMKRHSDVYIDISRDAIVSTVQSNPDVFSLSTTGVKRISDQTMSFFTSQFIDGRLNNSLPDNIGETIQNYRRSRGCSGVECEIDRAQVNR